MNGRIDFARCFTRIFCTIYSTLKSFFSFLKKDKIWVLISKSCFASASIEHQIFDFQATLLTSHIIKKRTFLNEYLFNRLMNKIVLSNRFKPKDVSVFKM